MYIICYFKIAIINYYLMLFIFATIVFVVTKVSVPYLRWFGLKAVRLDQSVLWANCSSPKSRAIMNQPLLTNI